MSTHYIPKVELTQDIGETKMHSIADNPFRMKSIEDSPEISPFEQLMTGMGKELNNTVKAPDQAMQDSLSNNGPDVHDVMVAISKAELGINIATQVTTKVVQAYEKVMSIQV